MVDYTILSYLYFASMGVAAPAITHKSCETALLSLFNAMPILRLMQGTERNSVKSSKPIRPSLLSIH